MGPIGTGVIEVQRMLKSLVQKAMIAEDTGGLCKREDAQV